MRYQVTIRHGSPRYRYHTLAVDAPSVAEALHAAGEAIPVEVARDADLVELREAVAEEDREYVGE